MLKVEARHPAAFAHPFQGFAAREVLLMCGVLASLVYVGTDVAASILYPGYSFRDQAVSELFAIGAPTGRLVVPLFTLSSLLIAAFAASGISSPCTCAAPRRRSPTRCTVSWRSIHSSC